jgi:hypothetical protein
LSSAVETLRVHKDTPFGWVKLLQDFMAAQAQARPERGLLLWGETRPPASPLARPDSSYQLIRMALRPRM